MLVRLPSRPSHIINAIRQLLAALPLRSVPDEVRQDPQYCSLSSWAAKGGNTALGAIHVVHTLGRRMASLTLGAVSIPHVSHLHILSDGVLVCLAFRTVDSIQCPNRIRSPDRPTRSSVAIQTELPGPMQRPYLQ